MQFEEYLESLLEEYKASFDIVRSFELDKISYPAYAYFNSHNEKYILTRECKMWETDCYEHILFLQIKQCMENTLSEIFELFTQKMEPIFVRQEDRYPKPNHMYTYLTVVGICEQEIPAHIVKEIQRFRFMKNYLFGFRGYSEGRLLFVDLSAKQVITNRKGKILQNLYQNKLK